MSTGRATDRAVYPSIDLLHRLLRLSIMRGMEPALEGVLTRLADYLGSRPEILDAYLFGSHARGDARPHSDIDVAVFLSSSEVIDSTFGYAAALSADLMKSLGHDAVDVSILNGASPLLYARVLRDGIRIIARDPAATTTREGRALSRYCDYVPQLRKIDAAHASRIDRGAFGR